MLAFRLISNNFCEGWLLFTFKHPYEHPTTTCVHSVKPIPWQLLNLIYWPCKKNNQNIALSSLPASKKQTRRPPSSTCRDLRQCPRRSFRVVLTRPYVQVPWGYEWNDELGKPGWDFSRVDVGWLLWIRWFWKIYVIVTCKTWGKWSIHVGKYTVRPKDCMS